MFAEVLSFLARPFTSWVEGREARKYMKEEGRLEIQKAEVAFKVAEFSAKAERLKAMDLADASYDAFAQQEKRFTLADELLTVATVVLVGCHFFIPEAMASGWAAMGYSNPPWWLEFIIVGIYVSVFGLMRLFRAFNPFKKGNTN